MDSSTIITTPTLKSAESFHLVMTFEETEMSTMTLSLELTRRIYLRMKRLMWLMAMMRGKNLCSWSSVIWHLIRATNMIRCKHRQKKFKDKNRSKIRTEGFSQVIPDQRANGNISQCEFLFSDDFKARRKRRKSPGSSENERNSGQHNNFILQRQRCSNNGTVCQLWIELSVQRSKLSNFD